MSIVDSKFKGAPRSQREQLAEYVKLLLLWVAASDGTLDESELEFVSSHCPDSAGTMTTDAMLMVIRNADLQSFESALRAVAEQTRELRTAFLDLAITMSMADRRITITENHILRFYADALYLGIGVLEKRFQTIWGAAFAEPADPSSPAWWDRVSREGLLEDARNEGHARSGMSLDQARTVLGVSLSATHNDIENAYKNLAAIFQVNRIQAMGDAAVSVATEKLRRIEEAIKLLREN